MVRYHLRFLHSGAFRYAKSTKKNSRRVHNCEHMSAGVNAGMILFEIRARNKSMEQGRPFQLMAAGSDSAAEWPWNGCKTTFPRFLFCFFCFFYFSKQSFKLRSRFVWQKISVYDTNKPRWIILRHAFFIDEYFVRFISSVAPLLACVLATGPQEDASRTPPRVSARDR